MSAPRPKNLADSLKDRLQNNARVTGADANRIFLRYANERFLYRLSQSPYWDSFILKGATVFTVWLGAPHRNTGDLDLLGSGDNSVEAMLPIFRIVCETKVENDGMAFLPETLTTEPRWDEEAYPGLKVKVEGRRDARLHAIPAADRYWLRGCGNAASCCTGDSCSSG